MDHCTNELSHLCSVISSTVMSDTNASTKGKLQQQRMQTGVLDEKKMSTDCLGLSELVHVVRSGEVMVRWALFLYDIYI